MNSIQEDICALKDITKKQKNIEAEMFGVIQREQLLEAQRKAGVNFTQMFMTLSDEQLEGLIFARAVALAISGEKTLIPSAKEFVKTTVSGDGVNIINIDSKKSKKNCKVDAFKFKEIIDREIAKNKDKQIEQSTAINLAIIELGANTNRCKYLINSFIKDGFYIKKDGFIFNNPFKKDDK
ncbi:MAG: hypothetical protein LC122_02500 [Chitinophagales bacterium]|nr:hypothetical protein [Chitinophagales bacterium]